MKARVVKLLSVITILVAVMSGYVFSNSLIGINAPNVLQSKSNWCWAASSTSLLLGKGTLVTQNGFSTAVKGNSTNNETASAIDVTYGLSQYGYYAQRTGSLSVNQTRNILSSNIGIIAGYSYVSGGGNMVVISGHDSEVNTLEVMDPGVDRKQYYNDAYFNQNSMWRWIVSIY